MTAGARRGFPWYGPGEGPGFIYVLEAGGRHKIGYREWFELSSHDIDLVLRDVEHVADDPDDPAYWEPC